MTKLYFITGKLESEIMEILWKEGPSTVRDVLSILEKKRNIAYTTVMTVMARLADKGFLKKNLDESGAYVYTPQNDRKTYGKLLSKRTISRLIHEFGDVAIAQFFDVLERKNAKTLKIWKKKLRRIR